MTFRRQAALLFLVGILIAVAFAWRDGGTGRGTSGRYEFVDPGCEEVPVQCATPAFERSSG